MGLSRIGPFVLGPVIRAVPGARFVEAFDRVGTRVCLQLAFLRPADGTDAADREVEIRRLTRATGALVEAGRSEVHAHGVAELHDGRRCLYWALPALEGPWLPVDAISASSWSSVAEALTERLVDAHGRGEHAPLLTEHALIEREGVIAWLGMPVAPSPSWVGEGASPPRFSPVESGPATERGDLWRLGRVLGALATEGAITSTWSTWLQSLEVGAFASAEAARDALPSRVPQLPRPHLDSLFGQLWAPAEAPTSSLATVASLADADTTDQRPHRAPDALGEDGSWGPGAFATVRERALSVLDGLDGPAWTDIETPDGLDSEGRAAVAELAMSWSQPPFPTGESPWSLPSVPPADPPEADSGVYQAPEPATRAGIFDAKSRVLAVMLVFALLGSAALVAREGAQPKALPVASTDHTVRLTASPSGARAISVRDGRELGELPLEFSVAPGVETRLIVISPGHAPAELSIPERGALSLSLSPVREGAPCPVAWRWLPGMEAWPDDRSTPRDQIPPDGRVVRSASGTTVGAALVRCEGDSPASRLRPPPGRRRLRVSGPEGAWAEVDGSRVGPLPVDVEVDRAEVEVELLGAPSTRRWVPVGDGVEVQLVATSTRAS